MHLFIIINYLDKQYSSLNDIKSNLEKYKELLLNLVKKGIDPFIADNNGITPYSLMLRYQSGKITKGGEKLDFSPVLEEIELSKS
jgi:hypothetical protein